ncbi:methyl-accepting chemotaxis protein [Nodosilinea sp. P-1105]|uniref:methyl-accepting chemotaxis protein n=1 Tax=Nodosilinea sp. P-1105 TaxID=2546229 RepID=UPI00146AB4B5|nr:methyl-accepting chemotaxis protein [Nodosilinea sp. P-1105]NMF84765.1 GAF domain-containing protein [Nodosilinea sp. P-1105]
MVQTSPASSTSPATDVVPSQRSRVMVPATVLGKTMQRFEGWSLRQRLLVTVLPLALGPLLIEGLVSYSLTQRKTRIDYTTEMRGQALLASENISNNVDSTVTFAQGFARNPLVLEKVQRDRQLAESEGLPQLPAETLETQFIGPKQLAPDPTFNDYLAQVAENRNYAEIIVTEANGLNVGYSRLPSQFVQTNTAWWQQARSQDSWFSPPGYDASTFKVGLTFSQAIRDPRTQQFFGVVKFFIPTPQFNQLGQYLANAGLSGTQQVQLLDTNSRYVLTAFDQTGQTVALTPRSLDLVGGDVVGDLAAQVNDLIQGEDLPNPEAVQQQLRSAFPVRNLEVRRILSQESELESDVLAMTFTYGGKRYGLSTIPTLNWVAIASMDLAEIRAADRNDLVTLGLLGLALGGVAVALTGVVSRQLSLPMNELAGKAQAMAEGNLDVQADPIGSLEAQTLAQTFNTLVARVRSFLREQTLTARQATLASEITGAQAVTSADLIPIYERLVTEGRDILESDRLVVYEFGPSWEGSIVAEAVGDSLSSAFAQGLSDPCIPMTTLDKYMNDGVLLENSVATATFNPEHQQLLDDLQVKSILGVPLASQGQLYGLLITHHCHQEHRWQASEVSFLTGLGRQMGLVIERVKLIEKTQNLAEEQRSLKEGLQRNALQLLLDVDPVSQGDLTVRAQVTEDEIGTVADSYNATIANLRKIVLQVQDASRQVADTTGDNQTAVKTLAQSATQQANQILAALDRVQEMSTSVRLVATNAEKAEAAVRQAEATVVQGDDAMNRTVDGIMAIRETVADTAKKVKRLGESSQKISNVVNLISGFAAQTNMLALNASIEASRAGEGGKGFAVVAEEVRELARQSAEATTEIEKLVASIQAETNAVVTAMESGTEQVVTGTQLVDETRQSLNQITSVSRQISELVAAISNATVVQSQASEIVTATMNDVASTATENSTAANQVSDSFAQLRAVAQALQAEVGRFKVS